MKDNLYTKFIKNIGLLTISNFGSKILVFLLIPLYTSKLTTAEYGIYDLILTTINLLIPILIQNIQDSVMRFSFDNPPRKTVAIGIKYNCIGIIGFVLLIAINWFFGFAKVFNGYELLMLIYFLALLLYTNLNSFLRGINEVKTLAVSGIINTVSIIALNILFLVIFDYGLIGYFWAYIIGYFIANIYIIIRVHIRDYIRIQVDRVLEKQMLSYSRPLILNTIAWWITNASDRYVVTLFCGVAVNGIYSVAYKIPSILTMFQNIFLQAWQISAYDALNHKRNNFFENIYNLYYFLMAVLAALFIILSIPIAHILYAKDFFEAWIYGPFLMISVVLGAMSGYVGGVFSALKESRIYAYSTLLGAGINLAFNFMLVPICGAQGAAIATLVSYYCVWIVRIMQLKKKIDIKINLLRDHIVLMLLIFLSVALLYVKMEYFIAIAVVLFALLLLSFKKEIKYGFEMFRMLNNKLKK